jgi:hypothetical protein
MRGLSSENRWRQFRQRQLEDDEAITQLGTLLSLLQKHRHEPAYLENGDASYAEMG